MTGRTVLAAVIALLVVGGPAMAQTDPPVASRVTLVILPEDEARTLIAARGAALALGVNPRSRVATRFVAAAVDDAFRPLATAGIAPTLGATSDAPSELRAAVERGSGRKAVALEHAIRSPVAILVLSRADQIPRTAAREQTLVLGVGRRTPVVVALLGARGTLRAGDRPRPGIAVAADVRATFLLAAGARSTRSGLSPTSEPVSLAALDALTARFTRDDASRYALAVALSVALFAPLALALLARRARATPVVRRAAQAVALAPVGYLAGLFLAEAPRSVRILPVFMAVVGGALLPPSRAGRLIGSALLVVAAVIAVGALVAPFRPTGEPALTLWGSPLELNRSWGIVNSLAILMAVGLVAGWSFARAPDWVLVGGGLVAACVSGAAAVGANFVAPLWIIVTVWLAFAARRRGRLRARDLLWAAAAGATAFAIALLASLAGPESHGSAATERILDQGMRAVWDLIRSRVDVNVAEFTGRGVWFIVWTASMAFGLVVALGTALRTARASNEARHAYAGAVSLAAGAVAVLISEDTGVLVTPIAAAMAAAIWLHSPTARSPGDEVRGTEPGDARAR